MRSVLPAALPPPSHPPFAYNIDLGAGRSPSVASTRSGAKKYVFVENNSVRFVTSVHRTRVDVDDTLKCQLPSVAHGYTP